MRGLLLALCVTGSAALADPVETRVETMSAPRAYDKVQAGEMLLIDVRPHESWAVTGVPAGAEMLDFSDPLFFDMIDVLTEGDKSRPIGVICFTGGRSEHVAAELAKRGYRRTIDIAEGVRGSSAGPGWIARGLPVTRP